MPGLSLPHTVTLYHMDEGPDLQKTYRVTVLRGVLLEEGRAVGPGERGMKNADTAALVVPFTVAAEDGATGEAVTYLPPRRYGDLSDRSGHWTLRTSGDFFVRGEAVAADPGSFEQMNAAHDGVYRIAAVAERDYGAPALRHWEVEGC